MDETRKSKLKSNPYRSVTMIPAPFPVSGMLTKQLAVANTDFEGVSGRKEVWEIKLGQLSVISRGVKWLNWSGHKRQPLRFDSAAIE